MIGTLPPRDERAIAVENASFRWGYLLQAFGLLAAVAYRGFVRHESSWDLLAIVLLGGVAVTSYQATNRTLDRRWLYASATAIAVALVLGAMFGLRPKG